MDLPERELLKKRWGFPFGEPPNLAQNLLVVEDAARYLRKSMATILHMRSIWIVALHKVQ